MIWFWYFIWDWKPPAYLSCLKPFIILLNELYIVDFLIWLLVNNTQDILQSHFETKLIINFRLQHKRMQSTLLVCSCTLRSETMVRLKALKGHCMGWNPWKNRKIVAFDLSWLAEYGRLPPFSISTFPTWLQVNTQCTHSQPSWLDKHLKHRRLIGFYSGKVWTCAFWLVVSLVNHITTLPPYTVGSTLYWNIILIPSLCYKYIILKLWLWTFTSQLLNRELL